MIPRFGTPPRNGVVYAHRPGAYAILLGAGGLLLTQQRTDTIHEFQLPGGAIDPGESPIPALVREVREETGYSCRIDRRLAAFREFARLPEHRRHAMKICHIYVGRVGLRLGPPQEIGHRAVWMPMAAAVAQLANPGNRAVLRAFLAATRRQVPR